MYRLCDHHRIIDPEHVFRSMPYRLLAQWRAYSLITGTFGQDRNDIIHAINTSAIVNANRKQGSSPVKATKLMPYRYTNEEIEQAELVEKVKAAIRMLQ